MFRLLPLKEFSFLSRILNCCCFLHSSLHFSPLFPLVPPLTALLLVKGVVACHSNENGSLRQGEEKWKKGGKRKNANNFFSLLWIGSDILWPHWWLVSEIHFVLLYVLRVLWPMHKAIVSSMAVRVQRLFFWTTIKNQRELWINQKEHKTEKNAQASRIQEERRSRWKEKRLCYKHYGQCV